jgi:hypothetical protein
MGDFLGNRAALGSGVVIGVAITVGIPAWTIWLGWHLRG